MFATYAPINFDAFQGSLEGLLARNEQRIGRLLEQDNPTYTTFMRPLMDTYEQLDAFFTPLSNVNSTENSPGSQEAYQAALPLLSAYYTKLSHNSDLFRAIRRIEAEDAELDVAQKEVLRQEIRDYKLSGVDLPDAQKERLEAINLRLSELSNRFSQNLIDANNAYELIVEDPADVEGVPRSDLALAQTERDGKTLWRFTLHAPSYMAYMTYGPNRSLREQLYRAYVTRAPHNEAILEEMLALKDEKAKLLGFDHYSELSLATKMAAHDRDVVEFLSGLAEACRPEGVKEIETLHSLAKSDGVESLESYDIAYYAEKLKKIELDIDDELLRPYFELSRVLQGMLDVVSELFGIAFVEVKTPIWNEKVRVFDILEEEKVVARIYFDLEARPSKRGGAWMHDWQTRHVDGEGNLRPASAFVVGNFPASTPQTPSLLRHDDVVTLFHEMGHAIHHLFSRIDERFVSGIQGVAWDVVEFPSQFLENFAYEADILKRFAFHYESGEVMPEDLMQKIKISKNFMAATGMLRQLEFALFDFKLHQKLHTAEEVQELLDAVRNDVAVHLPPPYNKFQWGFAHIFAGGYAAGYYSYKWAEVLSADAFLACFEGGRINHDLARGYRHHILEKGGSVDMEQLYADWLGRKVDPHALLKLYGMEGA